MEQPVRTVCNYVDVIDRYCHTYDTDRVCYTATCTLKYNLDTLYFKYVYLCLCTYIYNYVV